MNLKSLVSSAIFMGLPVTAGAWRALEEGEVVVLSEGQILKG